MPISTEITIDAPPRVVRAVMLDFPKLSTWHTHPFFNSIQVSVPGKETGLDTEEGDKLAVGIKDGMKFSPIVKGNTPEQFSWLGSLPYILSGRHDFGFAPHPSGDADKTVFSQKETFTGLLSFLFDSPTSSRGKDTLEGWGRLDRDLKEEAERVWKAEQGKS